MDLFILLVLVHVLPPSVTHVKGSPPPTEYRYTLSNLSQEKTLHCTSLPTSQRPLCELEGALDAQGQDNDATKTKPHHHPLPGANKTCAFRKKNIYDMYPYSIPGTQEWNRVMEKYSAMHKRCMEKDFNDLDDSYTSAKAPTCQYMIYKPIDYGLGNRLLSLLSTLLYSILSARVLLLDYPEWGDLFCEPFMGSTIQLPLTTKLGKEQGPWYWDYRDAGCRSGSPNFTNPIYNTTIVNMRFNQFSPIREYESVACPMGFSRLRNIPFITLRSGNQFFVPVFFFNPVFTTILDELFPQKNPFHHLSRFLLAPADDLWYSIQSNLDIHATRRIGIQLREFTSQKYTPEYDRNVFACIAEKGSFLPRKFLKRSYKGGYIAAYMATMENRHLSAFNTTMTVLTDKTGLDFKLNFQRSDTREVHDSKHQQEAIIDIWVLSMSHVLFTSQFSTFGYMATGLAGIRPNFIETGSPGGPFFTFRTGNSCYVGQSGEPCFHFPPKGLSCQAEEPVTFSLQEINERTSTVNNCEDHNAGWVMIP